MKLVKFNSLDGMNGLNFINVFRRVFQLKSSLMPVIALTPLFLASCVDKPLKTGYIDINQINSEFKLAEQYDKHIKGIENEFASKLIFIKKELNLLEDKIKSDNDKNKKTPQNVLQKLHTLKKDYTFQENKAKKNISDSIKLYRQKLNAQINRHVYDYAQKNNFDYVYSPAGTGTFMYADSSLNITNDVLYYLNSR